MALQDDELYRFSRHDTRNSNCKRVGGRLQCILGVGRNSHTGLGGRGGVPRHVYDSQRVRNCEFGQRITIFVFYGRLQDARMRHQRRGRHLERDRQTVLSKKVLTTF